MKSNSSKPIDRESLLAKVRSAVKEAGGKRVGFRKFIASTRVSEYDIGRYFPRWEEVLKAAGFEFRPATKRIDNALLLTDWGTVVRKIQRLPSSHEYRIEGKYHYATLRRRFTYWHNIPHIFRAFTDAHPEWNDLHPLLPPPGEEPPQLPPDRPTTQWLTARQRARRGKQSIYGPLLDFGAMRHAPVNEQGVVFLFGMMAEKLGLMVEGLRTAFPDCEAKRRIGSQGWESVRIEFEYESRNFRDHSHDPEGCDLIVCWTHNWPECPLEVIALKDELARLNTTARN